ncbi:type II secretion system minor pseudopilin GspK [Legionella sp.]|uniref:type II secretion system minor pseudopilin GspK n=1 Tax=Legionella sp. TaxID=459 RepID=UPI003C8D6240
MEKNNKKQRGAALLTALFIMTLVAIVATAMSTKVQVDIYRTQLIIFHDKLYFASQAVAFWAMSELNDPKKQFAKVDADGMVSQYPKAMANIYPSVTLKGGLYDLQARYNLNNLVNKKLSLGFANLLGKVIPKIKTPEKINVALAINDWVSPYDLGVGKDKYLSYYLSQKPPYYPSHQLMSSNSELRLINNVSAGTYLALQPYITTLPESTPININTAPKQVLMALSTSINEENIKELNQAKGKKGIKQIAMIRELLTKLNIPSDQITLESDYFLSVAYASSENFNFTVYTLLKRNHKKGTLSVSIVRESFNVF